MLGIEIHEVGKSLVRTFMLQFKTYKVKLIQENLVQSVYYICTGLMVHTILNLAYSKEHMLFIKSTYGKHII